ncbi:hypothetical protein R6Q59_022117 [Mikania micrantha]
MAPELEKPRVTEIQVRMDCNGCVQKIKKALHGINGIYDIYIDIPQQKLTIIGWADPEKIVKAIKKTRKNATICSHTTPLESEPLQEGEPESSETTNHPSKEDTPPTDPPTEPENPLPDTVGTPHPPMESTSTQPPQSSGPKEVEEVHVVHHYPPDHTDNVRVYNGHVDHYHASQGGSRFIYEPQPIHVNHSYNTYKPTPYVTEYEYIRPPSLYTPYNIPEPPRYTSYIWPEPPCQYTHYSRQELPYQLYNHPEPPQPSHSQREPPPQQYNRPESSSYYNRAESPPQHYNRAKPPPLHYSRPTQSPQHYSQAEPPPQDYTRPKPTSPQQNHTYPPQQPSQQNHTYPPQQNHTYPPQQPSPQNRQDPSQQYNHPKLPQQYIRHSRVEPSPLYTYYNVLEPPYYNMHYNDEYHQSSRRKDDITSPFGDEDPNGCKIV